MAEERELAIEGFPLPEQGVLDAIRLAADEGQLTWITDGGGNRVAAIVPLPVPAAWPGRMPPSPVAPVNVAYLSGLLSMALALEDLKLYPDEIEKRLRDA